MRANPVHEYAMLVHSLRRFQERCGVALSAEEYNRMVDRIRADNLPPVAVTSGGHRVFKVRVRGATGYAVWKRGTIATFYPSVQWVIQRGGKAMQGGLA